MSFCSNCGKLHGECFCDDRSRSCGRGEDTPTKGSGKAGGKGEEGKEASSVEDMFKALMGKSDAIQQSLGSVREEVRSLDAKFTGKVEALDTKFMGVTGDLDNKRVKELENGRGGQAGQTGEWSGPKHLEVKGFCTWDERVAKGATKDQVRTFVKEFKESLSPEMQAWVGAPIIKANKLYKFQVKVDQENIWEVKDLWETFVAENDKTLSGNTPRIIVERSPAAQKVFNKMGALVGRLQKKIKAPAALRPDWRIKEVYIKKDEAAEEVLLVSVDQEGGITWDDEGVLITGFTKEQLNKEMA